MYTFQHGTLRLLPYFVLIVTACILSTHCITPTRVTAQSSSGQHFSAVRTVLRGKHLLKSSVS